VIAMLLEMENCPPVHYPSKQQVRDAVLSIDRLGPTYGSLSNESGDYVQVAGGRPWCMAEWRRHSPIEHKRATTAINRKPYVDGARIHFTAGPVQLREDEWLLRKQAADIFVAFLNSTPFPAYVEWRVVEV
jgi:hypothetical protein